MHMSRRTDIFVILFLISASVSLARLSITPDSVEVARLLGSAVGVSAGVAPNEYNTLAQQLREKQEALALTESDLARREAAVREAATRNQLNSDRQMMYLLFLTGGLFVAVIVNFYFDIRRGHLALGAPAEQARA